MNGSFFLFEVFHVLLVGVHGVRVELPYVVSMLVFLSLNYLQLFWVIEVLLFLLLGLRQKPHFLKFFKVPVIHGVKLVALNVKVFFKNDISQ